MQQVYLPTLSRVNKALVIVLVASFILNSLLLKVGGISLSALLGLSLVGLKSGFVFQFITYPLVNVGLMEVVFTGLLLWFLGSDLESQWGEKKYIAYLVLTSIVSGIVYIVVSAIVGGSVAGYPLHGMSVFSSAMCVSYAVIYPDRMFQFFMLIPIKAKWFCLILAGMNLYSGVFTPGMAQAWGQLAAMTFGFFFIRLLYIPAFNKFFLKKSMKKVSKKKSHLSIVRGHDDGDNDDDGPTMYH